MLTSIRELSQSLLGKIFFFFVAFTFVGAAFMLWGDVGPGQNSSVATVGDIGISRNEYRMAVQQVEETIRQQFGGQVNQDVLRQMGVESIALNSLINTALQKKAAIDAGIVVTDTEVTEAIMSMEEFKIDGIFDARKYQELLSLNGINVAAFEKGMRGDLLVQRLRRMIERTSSPTDAELYAWRQFENQPITVSYVNIATNPFEAKVDANDEALAKWYDNHKSEFEVPQKREFRALMASPEALVANATISDDSINEYYEESKGEFSTEEKVKARHILIQTQPTSTAEEKKAAKEKIDKAVARVNEGESFEDVAKDISEGPSSAQGGDLGEFGRGAMVPKFEDVAFSLEPGKVSEPFRTQFGWHIVKVDEKSGAGVPPLEKVRDQIVTRLKNREGRKIARESMEKIGGKVTPDNFSTEANNNDGLTVENFAPTGKLAVAGSASQELVDAAWSLNEKDISSVIETDSGFAIVMLEKIIPAKTPAFDEVKTLVSSRYKKEEATILAETVAIEIKTAVNEGKTMEAAVKESGLANSVLTSKPFSRKDIATASGSPSGGMISEAFTLADLEASLKPTGDGFTVFTVKSREAAETTDLSGDDAKELRRQLDQAKSERLYAGFVKDLRAKADADGIIKAPTLNN